MEPSKSQRKFEPRLLRDFFPGLDLLRSFSYEFLMPPSGAGIRGDNNRHSADYAVRMARPRRYTEAQVITALIHTRGMVHLAAKHLGCDPDTVQRYCHRYPRVQAAKEAQRGEMLDEAELHLWRAIQEGQPWAIVFCLRTLGRHRGYTEKVEYTGKDGEAITIKVVYAEPLQERPNS
jgi:hypothetical protein